MSAPTQVEAGAIAGRVRAFIREVVVPLEASSLGEHGIEDDVRRRLHEQARDAGIFAPTVERDLGGLGLDYRGMAQVLEASGYSPLGPHALNCNAPDEGNMHLLSVVATEAQRERYLLPLARGDVRSAFAMTEPPPGTGSDPGMLATTARREQGEFVINGDKHFITGGFGAAFFIVMARTADEISHDQGATMFLVPAGHPGVEVVRSISTADRAFAGGHAVMRFRDCRVGQDAVLGEVGLGYRYAQVRLAPARLTHCMRWTGLAERCLDVALGYTSDRQAFGKPIGELGIAQAMIADCVIDIETSRSMIQTAAAALDAGGSGRHETSVAKVFVAEALHRVADRCIQLCGGMGVSHELPLVQFAAELRAFRIYDGPSEVHRWAIARRAVRRHGRAATP